LSKADEAFILRPRVKMKASMRSFRVLILLGALAATAVSAQEMYPGQSVSVNPAAAGTRVLLYPGGQYVRVVPPLMQPGATLEPIHLHMPVHRRVARVHHAPKVAADMSDVTVAGPADTAGTALPPADTTPAPAPKHRRPKHTEVASAPAPDTTPAPDNSSSSSDSGSAAIPFSFGGSAPPPPASTKKPAKQTKVATAEPPPAQTPAADAQPAKAPEKAADKAPDKAQDKSSPDAGFAKRGEIVFKHDATDPAPAQFDGLKLLAGDLNTALQSGATRIQLQAFGGNPGDKGSDARRLSLKRALAIRQVLIDNGVPSGKIDIRAMGGIDDKGNADRVDVLVRAS
jgi:outer membrane protein OmpA-like peptidoglycan-associated protein